MTQQKVMLVTVSDDRFGRKDGMYEKTQRKIEQIFNNNPQFGVTEQWHFTFENILYNTKFYQQNRILLDNKDAGRNGRAYKPYVISESLKELKDGEFLIYTDCSPEMWNMHEWFKISEKYNIEVLKNLCIQNNGILTAFVKWDIVHIPQGALGIHTHHNFTMDRCIEKMGMEKYRHDFMHASGMWVIQKSPETVKLVEDWLYWNCIDECCSLGKADVEDDCSFWDAEEDKKIGHRHDQSISGLLINAIGNKLVEIPKDCGDMHPYNFLQFARTDVDYVFLDSINKNKAEASDRNPEPGDTVVNGKGIELTVFDIEKEGDVIYYVVGKIRASAYRTTKENLKII